MRTGSHTIAGVGHDFRPVGSGSRRLVQLMTVTVLIVAMDTLQSEGKATSAGSN